MISDIVSYSTHFLESCVGLIESPFGVIVVSMLVVFSILAIWEDLRP